EAGQLPHRRNHPQGKHHRLDRSSDDHQSQPAQRTGLRLPRIHDRSTNTEESNRRDALHTGESCLCTIHDRRREKRLAPGRSRRVHAAHLLLARRAAPREIYRSLERGKARPVTPGNPSPSGPGDAVVLLEIRQVAKRFGVVEVLKGVSLQIAAGEFLTLLGESGSGKTTLLRLIAGFEQPTSGEIWMDGERLDTLPPYKRRVNTVFQSYALFPHLSVRDNVSYGLEVSGTPKAEIPGRLADALRMVKMEQFAAQRP